MLCYLLFIMLMIELFKCVNMDYCRLEEWYEAVFTHVGGVLMYV